MKTNMKEKRNIWKYPWGYAESYLITMAIFTVGLLLDAFAGIDKISIASPINTILLVLTILLTVAGFLISKKKKAFRWLYSTEASISSISLFAVVTMALALIPEKHLHSLGFADFRYSFTFILAYGYLLIILGSTVLKRAALGRPEMKRIKDIAFLLNHFGLWLALVAMGFGIGDMKVFDMQIDKGETVWYASDAEGNVEELEFAVELNEFKIEFYNPKYGIIENASEELYKKHGKPLLKDLDEGEELKWENKRFVLQKYIPAPDFKPGANMQNLAPARGFFQIFENEKLIDSGWVSCGNEFMAPVQLEFDPEYSLIMATPEPSLFESDVKIYKKSGETLTSKIAVNKPLTIGHYKIYQTSYEKSAQGYRSIFSIIYEPWLIYVYFGSLLMILGALYLIFSRINLEKK